jgi:SAM-dependent methyltransferase
MDFFVLEQTFDLVLAFEVLEHYRDDQACLQKWVSLLNPGGVLIFSVPAHRRQWTSNDTRAGHARRYEKDELTDKLLRQGFRILCLWCYGFPLLNWTYPLSQLFGSDKAGDPSRESRSADKVQLNQPAHIDLGQSANISESLMTDFVGTAKSGTRRFDRLSRWIFHEWLWWPFLQIQRPFLNGDLGIGYIVKCSKS